MVIIFALYFLWVGTIDCVCEVDLVTSSPSLDKEVLTQTNLDQSLLTISSSNMGTSLSEKNDNLLELDLSHFLWVM